ncbi:MAG: NAD(P)/FAD-dependent oxidoreductase [Myxococcota bacterium]
MADVDLVVIGAGNAGLAAAAAARVDGRTVTVIERRDPGGTCPIRGCVPKKVLVAAAETLDTIARAAVHGIHVAAPTVDWPTLIARKREFVRSVPADVAASLTAQGIGLVRGEARFVGRTEVAVGADRYRARQIVVATGSTPRRLGFPGGAGLPTSDDLLELDALPRAIVFVGGGPIAFEFAHVFARMGVAVTIVETGARALSRVDEALAERVVAATRALGVRIEAGVDVRRVDGERVEAVRDGVALDVAGRVFNVAGRVADTATLDLAAAGVDTDAHGAPILDRFQRSASNLAIAFAGDAHPGLPQLSPLATREGALAWRSLSETDPVAIDPRSVPAALFTVPPAAWVGRTLADAQSAGIDVEVHDTDTAGWRSARTYGDDTAFARVLIERTTRRLVGAHLIGRSAPEVIHAFAFVIRHDLAVDELRDAVAVYPTFHADLKSLIE